MSILNEDSLFRNNVVCVVNLINFLVINGKFNFLWLLIVLASENILIGITAKQCPVAKQSSYLM